MPVTEIELAIALSAAFISAFIALRQAIWRTRIRAEHLKVAIVSSNDFYDRAETLLRDPATPVIVKQMIFDIGLAVTSEKAGRRAAVLIMEALLESRVSGRVKQPRQEFLELLNDLRRSRGDLYDAFHEALSAAFTAIVSAHASSWERSKLALSYDVTGANRSKTLSLAEGLDAAIAGWGNRGRNDNRAAWA